MVAAEKLKQGTKYERLAALVFKVLDANADVVNQVILRADDKSASHEINVAINYGGQERSMLIECRDRVDKVEEGDVRDFFGKLHHLQPDVGIMLSPTGFTKGAVDYANDEGIILGEFRPVAETDSWVRSIGVEMRLFIPGPPSITDLEFVDPDQVSPLAGQKLHVDPYSDVWDASGDALGTLGELMAEAMKEADSGQMKAGRVEGAVSFDSARTIKLNGLDVGINGLKFYFDVHEAVEMLQVQESGVGEMILRQMSGADAGGGRVVFDKDFRTLGFDDTGRVLRR